MFAIDWFSTRNTPNKLLTSPLTSCIKNVGTPYLMDHLILPYLVLRNPPDSPQFCFLSFSVLKLLMKKRILYLYNHVSDKMRKMRLCLFYVHTQTAKHWRGKHSDNYLHNIQRAHWMTLLPLFYTEFFFCTTAGCIHLRIQQLIALMLWGGNTLYHLAFIG